MGSATELSRPEYIRNDWSGSSGSLQGATMVAVLNLKVRPSCTIIQVGLGPFEYLSYVPIAYNLPCVFIPTRKEALTIMKIRTIITGILYTLTLVSWEVFAEDAEKKDFGLVAIPTCVVSSSNELPYHRI